jgi:aspartyl/asparaginyl beta-hydroxylase (cupin superfamily)
MEFIKKIPGCTQAMFSVLSPGKIIKPHTGIYAGILRYHLGLNIPKNHMNCFISVNKKKYYWENGKDVMFNDMLEHYVENNTDESRIILLLDIKKDFNNIFINALNTFLLYFTQFNDTIIPDIINKSNEE